MGDSIQCTSSMNNTPDIVIVGSCMIDLVSYVTRLPIPGETIHGYKFIQGFGGKGTNQCVSAAKLGASTGLIAKLGGDNFGKTYLKELIIHKNINTKYVSLVENMTTGMASISVANDGENQIIIVPGANNSLSADDIETAKNMLCQAKIVVFQGETPWETTLYTLSKVLINRNSNTKTIVNAAPAIKNINKEIMSLADIFCINEIEAEIITDIKITNETDSIKCVKQLLEMGCNTVIITLGGNGVVYASKDEPKVKTIKVNKIDSPVDTTGAGDCFIGALSYYLCYYSGLPLGEIISRSSNVARFSVMKCGTQNSFPLKEELEEKLFLVKKDCF